MTSISAGNAGGRVAFGSLDASNRSTSLAHFDVRSRTLHESKLIAHRVMRDAIQVAAFGLGEPIQMIEIEAPDGATPAKASRLTSEDVRVLGDKVTEWKLAEGEVLTNLVGAPAPAAPGAEDASDAGSSDAAAPVES